MARVSLCTPIMTNVSQADQWGPPTEHYYCILDCCCCLSLPRLGYPNDHWTSLRYIPYADTRMYPTHSHSALPYQNNWCHPRHWFNPLCSGLGNKVKLYLPSIPHTLPQRTVISDKRCCPSHWFKGCLPLLVLQQLSSSSILTLSENCANSSKINWI